MNLIYDFIKAIAINPYVTIGSILVSLICWLILVSKNKRIKKLREIIAELESTDENIVVRRNLNRLDSLIEQYYCTNLEYKKRSFYPGTNTINIVRELFVKKFPEYEHLLRPHKKE